MSIKIQTKIAIFLLALILVPVVSLAQEYSNAGNSGSDQIHNIKKIIGEKTPEFLAKPIIWGVTALEDFRVKTSASLKEKKDKLRVEISLFGEDKISPTEKAKQSELAKPFKYAILFFVFIAWVVFSYIFVFYGFVLVIVFLILRSIWRLFF